MGSDFYRSVYAIVISSVEWVAFDGIPDGFILRRLLRSDLRDRASPEARKGRWCEGLRGLPRGVPSRVLRSLLIVNALPLPDARSTFEEAHVASEREEGHFDPTENWIWPDIGRE